MESKRKRTVGEQMYLLEGFYEDIYRDYKDFAGEHSQFQGEGNNEVGDEAVYMADNHICYSATYTGDSRKKLMTWSNLPKSGT